MSTAHTFFEAVRKAKAENELPDYVTATSILNADAVGRHLGIRGRTILRYLYESQGAERRYSAHPFPSPAGRLSGAPYWTLGQLPDIYVWADTRPGQGAGGGRPAHKET